MDKIADMEKNSNFVLIRLIPVFVWRGESYKKEWIGDIIDRGDDIIKINFFKILIFVMFNSWNIVLVNSFTKGWKWDFI